MKRILTTTAIILTAASPAFAESHPTKTDGEMKAGTEMKSEAKTGMDKADHNAMSNATFADQSMMSETPALLTSDLIGKYVYTAETEIEMNAAMAEADTDWNNIGEVKDVVMSADGKAQSILLDIGGFLGLGEHTVAVNLGKLALVADSDNAGDYFVVVNATKEQLEAAPEFDMDKVGDWTAAD